MIPPAPRTTRVPYTTLFRSKIGTSAGGSQVDSQALVAANGTTGTNTVDTGTYFVAESFDSPTSASDYTTSLACTDNGQTVAPGANSSLTVADGHTVVCTYTNTRKQGSVELTKARSEKRREGNERRAPWAPGP